MSKKNNILYIVTDQQSASMLSCAGNNFLHTPAIDSLAAKGTRFLQAYCTNPVCIPSRISLFSGEYATKVGCGNNAPPTNVTPEFLANGLGHTMRKANYRTLFGGKQHFVRYTAEDIGFEVYSTDEREELVESACNILKSYNDEKPFFMVVSLINPHDICYLALNEYIGTENQQINRIKEIGTVETATLSKVMDGIEGIPTDKLPPLPDNYEIQENEPKVINKLLEERPFKKQARELWDERKWREHRYAYSRLTELVDSQISKVLAVVPEDTVIIFTSDHGDHAGSHRLEHKSTFYQESTNIPLIIVPPNGSSADAKISQTLTSNAFDVYATICDYANATIPDGLEKSYSLRSIVEGKVDANTRYRETLKIESQIGEAQHTGTEILAHYQWGEETTQLYNLELDPGQMRSFENEPEVVKNSYFKNFLI